MNTSVNDLLFVIEQGAKRLGFDEKRADEIAQTTLTQKYPNGLWQAANEERVKQKAEIEAQLNQYLLSKDDTACCIRDYIASLDLVGREVAKDFLRWLPTSLHVPLRGD